MSDVCGTLTGMTRVGYARASTREQNLDSQLDALRAAGCERVFVDKVSGKLTRRSQWDACRDYLRPGDEPRGLSTNPKPAAGRRTARHPSGGTGP